MKPALNFSIHFFGLPAGSLYCADFADRCNEPFDIGNLLSFPLCCDHKSLTLYSTPNSVPVFSQHGAEKRHSHPKNTTPATPTTIPKNSPTPTANYLPPAFARTCSRYRFIPRITKS